MERTSTRQERVPWGTAFFHDEYPLRYDANMAIADARSAGRLTDDVVRILDELYGGFRHREIEFASVGDAESIAMGMVEHGYALEQMVVMALRRAADRDPETGAVEELVFDEMEPFIAEMTRREPWGTEPGMAEMLAEFRRVLVDGVGARFFAQRIDGRLAGSCELYLRGDVAQIEDDEHARGVPWARCRSQRRPARRRGSARGGRIVRLPVRRCAGLATAPLRTTGVRSDRALALFTRWPHDKASRDGKSPVAG